MVSSEQSNRDGNLTGLLYMIPENWLDTDWKNFIYPATHFHVNGLYPWDWNLINFKKRRFPEMTFVEYEIMDIITECGSGKLIIKKFIGRHFVTIAFGYIISVTFEAATEEIRKIKDGLGMSRNLGHDNQVASNMFNWSTQQLSKSSSLVRIHKLSFHSNLFLYIDSPAGSLRSLDAGNLGENTSFAASTPLSNFSPGIILCNSRYILMD